MNYLFTSESVSEGHPDKVSDQISDALLDHFLAFDSESKVAIETMVTTGQVIVAGEVKSRCYVDVQEVARKVINDIGYTDAAYRFQGDSCGVLNAIHEQSGDIRIGVEKKNKIDQGAGDQGMMFGYACNETADFMPLPIQLAHMLLQDLSDIRKNSDWMPYLRPDSKSQVTLEYDKNNKPVRVHTIVISTQHDPFDQDELMMKKIRQDVRNILIPKTVSRLSENLKNLFDDQLVLHVNPTGKFVIGGPHGDTGLTGRKIIVDTYGGRGAHGGGAFSGKDPSKVDRSATYMARYMAKNMVAAGIADEVLVQLSYAIGIAEPVGLYINTNGTSKIQKSDTEIANVLSGMIDLRPAAIEDKLKLRKPIYTESAAYGHMGRTPVKVVKKFESPYADQPFKEEVELFTWEKLDLVDQIKEIFSVK